MPQPIYLPKDRSPFESLLPMVQQMFMMKFHHKMNMDVMDAETKRRSAEKAEQRGYQEKTQIAKEKRGEQTQIRKEQRVTPYKEGQFVDFKIGDVIISYKKEK